MVCGPKALLQKAGDFLLHVVGRFISLSTEVRNLGAIQDSTISSESHIKSVTKSAFCYLQNVSRLRPSLIDSVAGTSSTHSSPPAWTYCSGVLFWTPPATILDGVQYVQNSVTRVLTCTKPWHHITPTLKHHYWLLVNFRITYKLLNLSTTLALRPRPLKFPNRPILRSSNLRSPLN